MECRNGAKKRALARDEAEGEVEVRCDCAVERKLVEGLEQGVSPLPWIVEVYDVAPVFSESVMERLCAWIKDSAGGGLDVVEYVARGSSANAVGMVANGVMEWLCGELPESLGVLKCVLDVGGEKACARFCEVGGIACLGGFVGGEYTMGACEVLRSMSKCDVYAASDEESEDVIQELFVRLIELENEGVTEMVVETLAKLFGVSDRARFELSDVVFGHIENIVFHTGLSVRFLKLLSECSFESFPLETIGETVELMLLDCFASENATIVACALDIFRECFAVHTEWVDHGKLVDAVLSLASNGTYDIKKSACGALIEMCNSCPLDRILDLMRFHVVQGLCDIVESEDNQSALVILECLGDLGAKTKTLLSDWAESDLVNLVQETLERLIEKDDKAIASKALYELQLLKDDLT